MLSDGIDIYGPDYTDCVLAVRTSVIEEHPEGLKALIKGMLKAQLMVETQREQTLQTWSGTYYKTSLENARIARKQPPWSTRAADGIHPRPRQFDHRDGLHQEEARP